MEVNCALFEEDVVGVAWRPMDRRMRLKEAALADIHVMSLPECGNVDCRLII